MAGGVNSGQTLFLSGWVTHTSSSIILGIIRPNARVRDVVVEVTEAFDGTGTDLLDVGYSGDADAYTNNVDISSTGIKTVTLEAGVGWDGVAREVTATYTDANSDATQGKCLVIVFFEIVPLEP